MNQTTHKSFLMTTTLATPFVYYTTIPELPQEALEALERANSAFQNSDIALATQEYRKALSIAPHSSHLMSNLGAILCAQNNMQEGLNILKQAAEQQKPCSGGLYNLGSLLLGHGVFDKARNYLEMALATDDNSVGILNNLGVTLFHLRNFSKAREYLDRAIIADPASDYPYLNIGMLFYEEGNFDEAAAWLIKAYQINNANVTALNNLGCVSFLKEDATAALDYLKRAVALQPQYRMPYFNIGYIVAQQ